MTATKTEAKPSNKRTVYVPPALNAEIDKYEDINVSQICQAALTAAVNFRSGVEDPKAALRVLLLNALQVLNNEALNLSQDGSDGHEAPAARRVVRRLTS